MCVCVCVCFYFNMGEVTFHLYVDGNNPEEEIFLMQVKEGRIAGVMRQYFSR